MINVTFEIEKGEELIAVDVTFTYDRVEGYDYEISKPYMGDEDTGEIIMLDADYLDEDDYDKIMDDIHEYANNYKISTKIVNAYYGV